MKFKSDIKINQVKIRTKKLSARYPLKFGGVVMDYVLLVLVEVEAQNRAGKRKKGYASMPFAHMWGWPKSKLQVYKKDRFMCERLKKASEIIVDLNEYLNPFRIAKIIEEQIVADEDDNMPKLNILLSISPLDAAVHDVFGRIEGKDTYSMYSKEYMDDTSNYLDASFKGKFLSDYIQGEYKKELPLFHLIGGLDPLTESEINEPINDGLPETLEGWIKSQGIYCFKIKWKGNDLCWDMSRALDVFNVAKNNLSNTKVYFTGDTNEQCKTPEYMLELLRKIQECNKELFDSILYIEQPTDRDIWTHPYDFRNLSNLKPVIMDESLVDMSTFQKGMELGVKGIALKTCKGHSESLLYVAKCEELGIPYAVQDLSLPGIAFIHSAGLAARINTIMGIEGNGRQYFPNGSEYEKEIYSDLFNPIHGNIQTGCITGNGMGFPVRELIQKGFLEGFTEIHNSKRK